MTKEDKFKQEVFEQIQRLSGLPHFPFAGAGVAELVTICVERSRGDITRVKTVVNSFVDCIRCPTPGEFKAAWFQQFPPPPRDPGWNCVGTPGWLITWIEDRDGNDVSQAARCSCGAISRFREPTAEERENMRPFNPREKAEFEAENDQWFEQLMAANRKRRHMLQPRRELAELYPDAATIREREMMREA